MFERLLEKIALALQKRSIDYMVIGGQALLVYGEPRLTKDIDVTLGIDTDRLKDVLEMVKELGLKELVESPQEFAGKTKVLPCGEKESGIRVDFIFSFSPYERKALKRARRVQIGRAEISFASLEDFIVHKMIAGRPRDLEDIRTVLLKNPNVDMPYIRNWLSEFEKSLSQSFLKQFDEIRKSVL